jgi:hypothetical protein
MKLKITFYHCCTLHYEISKDLVDKEKQQTLKSIGLTVRLNYQVSTYTSAELREGKAVMIL